MARSAVMATLRDRELLLQLIRFAIAGAAIAGLQVLIYNLLIAGQSCSPQAANAIASGIVLVVGYAVHSRFTFRAHGSREDLRGTGARFIGAHMLGWLANTMFVALLVDGFGAPRWAPSIPMFTATPLMLFCLKRYWVFR